ncbi:ISL3 family transposase [Faecalibacillus faecis]|uniref:ISL3 family transposase n=1 Tax=Faecalibacillus faecis TaxID=1982628 RepID=UPI00386AD120
MNDDIINILNLNYSDVQSCSSKSDNNSITYFVTLVRKDILCPHCASLLKVKDYRCVTLSHQIIKGKDTKIVYRKRRYFCPNCKSYHYEDNPFVSESKHTFTDTTNIQIMNFLREHSSTFSMAARHFNTTPTKVVDIFDSLGQMKKLPFPSVISIDEFYWNRKSQTKYACAIIDFETGYIVDILNGRKIKNWDSYMQIIDKSEINNVKFICIDLYEPYRQVQKTHFPKATLICDSFHVVKNINEILRKERIKIMKRYDSDSVEYYLLKNFNYLLMMDSSKVEENKARYNKKLKRYINYPQLLELILKIDKNLKEAYELKEQYLIFNSMSTYENARVNLSEIIKDYASSNIEGYRKFSSTLIDWFEEIVNSFILYNGKRISNGKIEGTNSRIKTILKNANGFRNFSRMRNRIMFSINKNSLPTILEKNQQIKEAGKRRGKYKK